MKSLHRVSSARTISLWIPCTHVSSVINLPKMSFTDTIIIIFFFINIVTLRLRPNISIHFLSAWTFIRLTFCAARTNVLQSALWWTNLVTACCFSAFKCFVFYKSDICLTVNRLDFNANSRFPYSSAWSLYPFKQVFPNFGILRIAQFHFFLLVCRFF